MEEFGFTLKTGEPIRILRERFGQDLDRDDAFQARVAREIDLAHTARAQRGDWISNAPMRVPAVSGTVFHAHHTSRSSRLAPSIVYTPLAFSASDATALTRSDGRTGFAR